MSKVSESTSPSSDSGARTKSAIKIMAAVLSSRLLGLIREMVLNAIFGAGKELDAFFTAFRIPNLLRDLFAEGALSTAFVTIFSKKLTTEGKQQAFRLANLVMSSMVVILGIITLIGIFESEQLVRLIANGFSNVPGKLPLTVDLTRIMFPFILLVSLAAVYMGLLNSLGSFGLPASASTAFNAVSILTGVGTGYLIDPSLGPRAIYGIAIGTLLGGAAQWLIQVPKAYRMGYKPAWVLDWKDSGLRQIGRLMLPAIIGGAAVQVNVLVNTYFASFMMNGAVTWLNNAFRLMQLPIGMFGVAVATVTLPSVSQSAALKEFGAFRTKLVEAIRLTLFLTIPASVGLFLMAQPIIGLIYQHGAFTANDTAFTAVALQAYTIGLASYACTKVIIPAFYALDLTRIPLRVSLVGIALNIGLNAFFMYYMKLGLVGLPLATSLVALINLTELGWALHHRLEGLELKSLGFFVLRLGLASAAMGTVVWFLKPFCLDHGGLFLRTTSLFSVVSMGVVVFILACLVLQLQEMQQLFQRLKKRFKR